MHFSYSKNANVHKAFRKVLSFNTSKKRKLKFEEFPILPSRIDMKQDETKTKFIPSLRRVNVLNKIFMRYITDLIVNSEHWEKYNSLGIEITKVEVSQDYKQLNIFWISKKSENEKDILGFLENNMYTLRHELSQLKVIGIVPPVSFVKDKNHTQIMELDKRLAEADYGVDYEPLSVSRLKHQLELYCPLEENIKNQLEIIEDDNKEEELDVEYPEMPQNVLGLDHANIMKKLLATKKIQTEYNILGHEKHARISSENVEDTTSSRDAFISFLQKRQLLNQKLNKEDKNYNPDMEYIKEEMSNSFEEHYDNIEENLDKFEDYIEDETYEK